LSRGEDEAALPVLVLVLTLAVLMMGVVLTEARAGCAHQGGGGGGWKVDVALASGGVLAVHARLKLGIPRLSRDEDEAALPVLPWTQILSPSLKLMLRSSAATVFWEFFVFFESTRRA
jgi:hypothetical protein